MEFARSTAEVVSKCARVKVHAPPCSYTRLKAIMFSSNCRSRVRGTVPRRGHSVQQEQWRDSSSRRARESL